MFFDELDAIKEIKWLKMHNYARGENEREHRLVKIKEIKPLILQDLNDEIPF